MKLYTRKCQKCNNEKHVTLSTNIEQKGIEKRNAALVASLHNRTSNNRYKKNLEIFYKLTETVQVKINTPYGDTENIEIREVVKQETTYEPIMCCTSTAKINEIGEMEIWKQRKGMLAFIDDIAATWDVEK